jgi:pimeloyl-ACP methyl ester carboxylesterase
MRWIKRIVFIIGGLLVASVLVGIGYEQISRWNAARQFPVQGRLVDVGGRHMQIDCRGSGSPTVVFESGLDAMGSLSWSAVHDAIAMTTRACAYSRAGLMWSEPDTGEFQPEGVARDLHALLVGAGERGPFVMVGHSLGGPYIMNFTRLYPQEVAGLVFVDASHPDQNERITRAIGKKLDAGEGLLRAANALSWMGIPRLVASRTNNDSGIPLQAKQAQDAYFSRSVQSVLREEESVDVTFSAAGRLRDLGDRPTVVLTAMKPLPADVLKSTQLTVEQGQRLQTEWKKMHVEEASWSHHSNHEIVPDSAHYIQFDRPDVVIAAVRRVVDEVRSGAAPSTSSLRAPP